MIARAQIPNLLTFARVLAVPVALVIVLCYPDRHTALFALFLFASLTDFLDGYLARKWNATSPLGALLDPIADKLLVVVLLLYLLLYAELSLLPVSVIILRELYISGLREFIASRGASLPVSKGGKLKTALQMTGITLMLAAISFNLPLGPLGQKFIWLSAIFAVSSALQYTRASWPHLRG